MSNRKLVPVAQYEGTTLLAKYPSISMAALTTNTQPAHIGKVTSGKRNKAGGYQWKSMKAFDGEKLTPKLTGVIQTSLAGDILAVYADAEVAAKITGVNLKQLNKVLSGNGKRAGGFLWS